LASDQLLQKALRWHEIMEQALPIEIDVRSVKALLDAETLPLLLDCREQEEYDMVCIQGTRHIPMNEIPNRIAELDEFRSQQIVVHCHLGGRSLQVVQWLRSQGFDHAQNMTGGIDAWTIEIEPGLPRY